MNSTPPARTRSFRFLRALLAVVILMLVAVLFTLWWLQRHVHDASFTPVEITQEEQILLDAKLNAVDPSLSAFGGAGNTHPDLYLEEASRRKLIFSENDLNATLAKDPDMAQRVRFQLSPGLVSVHFLSDIKEGFPFLGGKTFNFNMDLEIAIHNASPSVLIRRIGLGGIAIPSFWWGSIKSQNLIEIYGDEGGFWDLFTRGVEDLEVTGRGFELLLKEY